MKRNETGKKSILLYLSLSTDCILIVFESCKIYGPWYTYTKERNDFLNISTSVDLTLQCTCADPENFPGVIRSERIILFFRGRGDSEAYFREFTM